MADRPDFPDPRKLHLVVERSAAERDGAADERDRAADLRDAEATDRDMRQSIESKLNGDGDDSRHRDNRHHSMIDRQRSGRDRRQSAEDRRRAADDRDRPDG